MEPTPVIEHVHEKNLAQVLLDRVASKGSEILDKFSSWLLAGFGGGLALIVANLSSVPISTDCVRSLVACFLVSATAAVLGKYLGSVINSGTTAGLEAFSLASGWPDAENLDPTVVLREVERAGFWPWPWLLRRGSARALDGDLLYGSRVMVRLLQIHSLVVLVQVGAFLVAVYFLYRGLEVA